MPASQTLARSAAPSHPQGARLLDLLERWFALGELERRAFLATVEDLHGANDLIERSTLALSNGFRDLAEAADDQTRRAAATADVARSIRLADETIPMTDATRFVAETIGKASNALDDIAGRSRQMARALDSMQKELAGVEDCVARIEAINRQARYVALNAAIEAQRSAGSGGAFMVIAQEVRDLARDTDATATLVRQRIAALGEGMRSARTDLAQLAATDGTSERTTRERLHLVLEGISAQNDALASITDEAAAASAKVAGLVGGLVTAAQFQDRCTQHLQHVIGAIETLGEAISALQDETVATNPELSDRDALDEDVLRKLLDRQTLSSVHQRFLARLSGGEAVQHDLPSTAGDVELF